MTTTITLRSLAEIEQSIQTHLRSLIELGRDLRAIRDGAFAEMDGFNNKSKTYGNRLTQILGYPTLQEYWLKRWNLKQRYVCQLIHSSEVADDLAIDGAIAPSILKESVIRPLGPIPREDRAEVFENAQEAAKKEG